MFEITCFLPVINLSLWNFLLSNLFSYLILKNTFTLIRPIYSFFNYINSKKKKEIVIFQRISISLRTRNSFPFSFPKILASNQFFVIFARNLLASISFYLEWNDTSTFLSLIFKFPYLSHLDPENSSNAKFHSSHRIYFFRSSFSRRCGEQLNARRVLSFSSYGLSISPHFLPHLFVLCWRMVGKSQSTVSQSVSKSVSQAHDRSLASINHRTSGSKHFRVSGRAVSTYLEFARWSVNVVTISFL